MEASEIIALVAILVTGVSIWLNYLGSNKRLDHEAKQQEKRLAHERAEAMRAKAAKAYQLAHDASTAMFRQSSPEAVNPGTVALDMTKKDYAAREALELISAVGWTEEVRVNADQLRNRLLEMKSLLLVEWQRSDNGEDRNIVALKHGNTEVFAALREFQEAISV